MTGILTYCFIIYGLGAIGTSLGYHRLLCHKSFIVPKWFEHMVVLIGLPAGTPIQWVGNHRAHHHFTDVKGDPHSPVVDGFWYAHCGWYINSKKPILCVLYALAGPIRLLFDAFWRPRTNQAHIAYASDISRDGFYSKISQPRVYQVIMLIYFMLVMGVSYVLFQTNGLIASWITLIIIYNLGDAVDSFGHLFGQKGQVSEARNNLFLGIAAFGDGWHANHHEKPRRAKHGRRFFQLDLTYLLIRFLKWIGIVKKVY